MPYTKEGIGHVDFDTSKASAERVPKFDTSLRAKIVLLIYRAGSRGLTCEEIEIALGARHQTVSSAIRRCVLADVLVDSGVRRRNHSGRKAAVWITPGNENEFVRRLRARRRK